MPPDGGSGVVLGGVLQHGGESTARHRGTLPPCLGLAPGRRGESYRGDRRSLRAVTRGVMVRGVVSLGLGEAHLLLVRFRGLLTPLFDTPHVPREDVAVRAAIPPHRVPGLPLHREDRQAIAAEELPDSREPLVALQARPRVQSGTTGAVMTAPVEDVTAGPVAGGIRHLARVASVVVEPACHPLSPSRPPSRFSLVDL
jgi:hypothetical protein